jgi:hypothetical protein
MNKLKCYYSNLPTVSKGRRLISITIEHVITKHATKMWARPMYRRIRN